MNEERRTVSRLHAAAGEAPESLRHRLRDANDASVAESVAAVDLEDLHESARDRQPAEAPKRWWRRR